VTLNAVLNATLTAKLQQLIDTGTYSALSAAVAIQAFSTDIKAAVDGNGGTGAFVTHVTAVFNAIEADTTPPDFGTPPVTFTLAASPATVNEGVAVTYTLTASAPAAANTEVTFSVMTGNDTIANQGTNSTNSNDFLQSALNPVTVVMAAGATTATFVVTAAADAISESPESYTVNAKIGSATVATKVTSVQDGGVPSTAGMTLMINGEATAVGTVAGGEIMHLTGDQDVRIDFTNPANQIKGLDLNGDGVITNNGVENNVTGVASLFEIVDAYARNPLNETDSTTNFLGDIAYDGTGFGGDGVTTDGNIVLGGLGADVVFGGIGNDFLTGGGIAAARVATARAAWIAAGGTANNFVAPSDNLSGGRNADFFFVELSALDATDGNRVNIDGGITADDSAAGNVQTAQDADWLLFEGSDDDEPVTINLRDESTGDGTVAEVGGGIVNRSGQTNGALLDIENFDASGNLYGFLDTIAVQIGGRRVDSREVQNGTLNNGIGSSAQLNVSGSKVANIIIGGYDNDNIAGNVGNDLLAGGNLANLINPNLVDLVGTDLIANDGRDNLTGGAGNDNIIFEADGGRIEGDVTINAIDTAVAPDSQGNDTLWLTSMALGQKLVPATDTVAASVVARTAADLTTDGVLRFDLDSQNIDAAAGYGGADFGTPDLTANDTQDQTNYIAAATRVTMQDVENVIATGLGAVDYDPDGTNTGDITHLPQVNYGAYNGDLTLRGTAGVNTLYAAGGKDVIEGRQGGTLTTNGVGTVTADGRDKLSGGAQGDKFIFSLNQVAPLGDGVDVIHRQIDANNDNIWDGYNSATNTGGTFGQDFGALTSNNDGKSYLYATFPASVNLVDPNVGVTQFEVTIDGVVFGATLTSADLKDLVTTQELAAKLNTSFNGQNATVHVEAIDGSTLRVTVDKPNAVIGTNLATGTIIAGTAVSAPFQVNPTVDFLSGTLSGDQLIYRAYEDRLDGELVNDNAITGSTISLGIDAYAQDLVVDFRNDSTTGNASTWLAEDQSYTLTFTNLTTQDTVQVNVNGVIYKLTVGVDIDGNEIGNEELLTQGGNATLAQIQTNFLVRLAGFITSFTDDDTAAGKIVAASTATTALGTATIVLTPALYNGEQTVFLRTPTVALTDFNASGGELASVTVQNNAQHEVELLDFNGRNGELNATNVLFVGSQGEANSRAILATGAGAAGTANTMTGSEAVVIDGGTNTLPATLFGTTTAIADNTATNSFLRTDFTVHGDDQLIGGAANDNIKSGTGDDRVLGSLGTDVIDGGKSYYAVQVLGELQSRVYVLNQWEATNPGLVTALTGLTISSVNRIGDAQDGNSTPVSAGLTEVYNDTLQFNQSDFTANTNFTVVLNGFTGTTAATVAFPNAGAGQVLVDDAGNGSTDGTTTFTNFENIRTVSGTGNAVANDGQGNDTLNVSLLSTNAAGISYDLTNDATAGDVRYGKDATINAKAYAAGITAAALANATVATVKAAILGAQETATFWLAVYAIPTTATTTTAAFLASVSALTDLIRPTSVADVLVNQVFPDSSDYETLVIKVDGVENVIGGNGADLLIIDETESAKNNSFTASTGTDRVEYQNNYASGALAVAAAALTADDGVDDAQLAVRAAALTNDNGVLPSNQGVDDLVAVAALNASVAAFAVAGVNAVTTAASAALAAAPAASALLDDAAEPTVTINVTGVGASTVVMTGGRVGSTVATDTLTGVEYVTLANNTAQGVREDDTLNASALTGGVNVNYSIVSPINAVAQETVSTGGVIQQVVEHLYEVERIVGTAAADTVTVADSARMSLNARTDAATWDTNIGFESYLNYDKINTNLVTDRLSLTQLASGTLDKATASAALPQVLNTSQFKFELGTGATDTSDTVNYSLEIGRVVAVVFPVTTNGVQSILVDGNNAVPALPVDISDSTRDRIDLLTGVDNVVASIGGGVLDLTGAAVNTRISFSNNYDPVANWNSTAGVGYGLETHQIKVADATSGTSLISTNYIDYIFADTNALVVNPQPANARWTSVEGSDLNETVDLSGWEAGAVNTLNLRGGSNRVNYEGDSVFVTLGVTAFNPLLPATTGMVTAAAIHTAPNDDHNPATLIDAPIAATDVITSYSQQNLIAKGDLTIKGARGSLDTISFANGLDSKYLVMGGVVDATSAITVKIGSGTQANSIQLVGFETLNDSNTNDAYDITSLNNVLTNLVMKDNPANDHDAVLLRGTDGVSVGNIVDLDNFAAAPATGTFGVSMDFDVLDVVNNTSNTTVTRLTLDGRGGPLLPLLEPTDEVVIGALSKIATISNFESVVLTKASVAAGSVFTLDTELGTLVQGGTTVAASGNVLSAGGTVFENTLGISYIDTYTDPSTGLNDRQITTGVTLNLVSAASVGRVGQLVGTGSNDFLNGSAGDDILIGNAGNDNITSGVTAEVRQINVLGSPLVAGITSSFNFMAQSHIVVTEGAVPTVGFVPVGGVVTAVVANGAGNDAFGTALAGAMKANLTIVNADWLAGGGDVGSVISDVTYNNQTDQLNITFATGVDVLTPITFAPIVEDTLRLTTETAAPNGSPGGANTIYGGAGVDVLTGGAGVDTFVVAGTYAAGAYAAGSQGALSTVLTNAELTAAHVSDTSTDTIAGGDGIDTIQQWGTVDYSAATLSGIEFLNANSDVTLTKAQFDMFTNVNFNGAGPHSLTITNNDGSAMTPAAQDALLRDSTYASVTGTGGNLTTIYTLGGAPYVGTIPPAINVHQSITATPAAVNEDGLINVATFNLSGFTAGPLAYTLTGTAANGADYSVTGGTPATLTVAANGTTSLSITTVADTFTDGRAETLILTAGGISQTVTINDTSLTPAAAPTLTLASIAAQTVTEGGAAATYTVNTTGTAVGATVTLTLAPTTGTLNPTGTADFTQMAAGVTTLTQSVATANGPVTFTLTPASDSVPEATAEVFTPTFSLTGATSVVGGTVTVIDAGGSTPVPVTAAGTFNASLGNIIFNIGAVASTYAYTVANFSAGDVLNFGTLNGGAIPGIVNDVDQTDGIQSYALTLPAGTVTITLTGLTAAQDAAIFNVTSFNAEFGAGSMI
jgi:hypothetical protein